MNGQCNLVGEDGMHYATIFNYENLMVVMFPLSPAKQPEGDIASNCWRLILTLMLSVLRRFSLAADNATVRTQFCITG
ncbi:hypothetical protein BCS62_05085 [Vibrio cyclitrophicus]